MCFRRRPPERPTWTADPVADAERYYRYLDELAEYEEADDGQEQPVGWLDRAEDGE